MDESQRAKEISFLRFEIEEIENAALREGEDEELEAALNAFKEKEGDYPKIVLLQNVGAFALCQSEKEIQNAELLLTDAMKVAYYARKFGGILPMTDELTYFITHWEAESYRKKQA